MFAPPAPFISVMGPHPEQDVSDAELLRAVARGDQQAFASLYDQYSHILFGLLLRILHRRSEAEDVLQEVFLQAWQKASDFDSERGRAFTWLVTLARSRAIDRLRAVESRDRTANRAAQETSDRVVDADDEAIRSAEGEIVRGALAQIPEEQRETLLLAYFEGLTQSEIAARLGEPLGTVKTRTRSGLIKLRDLLRNRF
ncbi:MAG TPA: sigma-70 family RNA polymerase sigma factor [Pyrinomonadaceae bacterium]|jgi:RNA polymerase sigma-70 factor (ECF subfamily)|nr:sigma-70 family RNA polymerase sigma factor [Pyrinomonadaceae bacterium]